MGLMGGNCILQVVLIDAGVHMTQATSLEHVESGCHFHTHVDHHGLHGKCTVSMGLSKAFAGSIPKQPSAACGLSQKLSCAQLVSNPFLHLQY